MNKTILLYDKNCPLCNFQIRLLTWIDLFHALRLVPYQDPQAAAYTHGIDPALLHASIHCVSPKQETMRGARALRHVCMRLPPALPLALLLWVPGALYVASEIYDGISRNRMRISRIFGCKNACAIIPARQRSEDVISTLK